jgi:Na+-transporting NADH:ubiquinone oxidoreductase subunit NqrC
MKTLLLILTISLTGCTTMGGVLNGNLAACIEAQKSMSRDQTMRDIAILEMAKTANDQTKMAAMTAITQSKTRDISCK